MAVPKPYRFLGGNDSDYQVFEGDAGTWCTRHIRTNKVIQSVQPNHNSLDPMLQFANLSLGLFNLGVGIYNAYQARKIRKDIEAQGTVIQTGFENINRVLNAQYRMLEILAASQNDLRDRLEIIRQEMQVGFQNVVKEIHDVEAHRRREEFETRTFKLLKAYERFGNALPELFDVERLIERAEELEAWLQSQLNRTRPGDLERFPLFVVLSFSIRAKVDAFQAQGGTYTNFAIQELTSLKNRLRNEVYYLCEGQGLFSLGVELPEILGQYVLLNRSLGKGIGILNSSITESLDSEDTAFNDEEFDDCFNDEELSWDDGLDTMRQILQPFNSLVKKSDQSDKPLNGKTRIRLNTISDYEWYISFSGEDRETFHIHTQPFLLLGDIFRQLGHPMPDAAVLQAKNLGILMRLALPNKQEEFMHKLQAEFEWEQSPTLKSSSMGN